jgi:hypothetical protein
MARISYLDSLSPGRRSLPSLRPPRRLFSVAGLPDADFAIEQPVSRADAVVGRSPRPAAGRAGSAELPEPVPRPGLPRLDRDLTPTGVIAAPAPRKAVGLPPADARQPAKTGEPADTSDPGNTTESAVAVAAGLRQPSTPAHQSLLPAGPAPAAAEISADSGPSPALPRPAAPHSRNAPVHPRAPVPFAAGPPGPELEPEPQPATTAMQAGMDREHDGAAGQHDSAPSPARYPAYPRDAAGEPAPPQQAVRGIRPAGTKPAPGAAEDLPAPPAGVADRLSGNGLAPHSAHAAALTPGFESDTPWLAAAAAAAREHAMPPAGHVTVPRRQRRAATDAAPAPTATSSASLSIGTIEVTLLGPPQQPTATTSRREPRRPPERLSRGLGPRFGQGQT